MSKYPAEIYGATSMLAFPESLSVIDINSTTHPASMPTMPCVQILWALLTIMCSLSWQLGDLHAKRTNPVSCKKKLTIYGNISISVTDSGAICRAYSTFLTIFLRCQIAHTFKSLCIPD